MDTRIFPYDVCVGYHPRVRVSRSTSTSIPPSLGDKRFAHGHRESSALSVAMGWGTENRKHAPHRILEFASIRPP